MSKGLNAPDWEAIDLLSMTSGAIDVRGAPIDPIARRVWGVPTVLNQGEGDDVGLIIRPGNAYLPVRSQSAAELSQAFGNQQNQQPDQRVRSTTITA